MEFQSNDVHTYVALIIPSHMPGVKTYLTLQHLNKKEHIWRFPGGKPEQGELLMEAAMREVEEELDITPEDLTMVSQHVTHTDGQAWRGFFFLCKKYKGIPRVVEANKHGAIKYMNLNELIVHDSDPEFRAIAKLEHTLYFQDITDTVKTNTGVVVVPTDKPYEQWTTAQKQRQKEISDSYDSMHIGSTD